MASFSFLTTILALHHLPLGLSDIIWFEDTETADLRSNWTEVGDTVILQQGGSGCHAGMTPTRNCWELQHNAAYIYRIASTKGYSNISFDYSIYAISADCTISFNTVNNDSDWTQFAFYSTDATCSDCQFGDNDAKVMLDAATSDQDYVGIKIEVIGGQVTASCFLSDLSLRGNKMDSTTTPSPTHAPEYIWRQPAQQAVDLSNWTTVSPSDGSAVSFHSGGFECSPYNCWKQCTPSPTDQDAYIERVASTVGYTDLTVQFSVSRSGALYGDTECRVYYAPDIFVRTRLQNYDLYTHYENESLSIPADAWNATAYIRFETWGLNPDACCHFHHLALIGTPIEVPTTDPTEAPTASPTELPSNDPTKVPTENPTISMELLVDIVISLNLPADVDIDSVITVIDTTADVYLSPIFGDEEYYLSEEVIENDSGKAKIEVIVTSPNEDIVVDEEELRERIEEALVFHFGSSIIDSEGEASETTSAGNTGTPQELQNAARDNLTALYVVIAVLLGLLLIGLIVFYVRRRKQSEDAHVNVAKIEPQSPGSVEMHDSNETRTKHLQSVSSISSYVNENEEYKLDIVEPVPGGSFVAAGTMMPVHTGTKMGSFISNAGSNIGGEENENSEEAEILYDKDEDDGKRQTTKGVLDDEAGATPHTPNMPTPAGQTADGENDVALDYMMGNDGQNDNENEQEEASNGDEEEEDNDGLYDDKNRKTKTKRQGHNQDDEELYVQPADAETTKGDDAEN